MLTEDRFGFRQAVPCPNGTLYTIQAGDTYFRLAQRFGTTVSAIAAANPGVDPNRLRIGQQICIPVAPPGPPPTTECPSGTTSYIIRAGDTYFRLAQRFGTTVSAIAAANPGVDPNRLQVGQRICIPGAAPQPPGECPAGTRPYIIQSGDTYFRLAQRFGTTVSAITAANPGVDPNRLQVGQGICIPEAAPPVPEFELPCVVLLEPVNANQMGMGAGGAVLIRQTGADQYNVSYVATGLPDPTEIGDFDGYIGSITLPREAPEPPTVLSAFLDPSSLFEQPITWAGTHVIADEPDIDSMVTIRLINMESFALGPILLSGNLMMCGS
jgi:LysM repeat protein